jgi:hypothetical protein
MLEPTEKKQKNVYGGMEAFTKREGYEGFIENIVALSADVEGTIRYVKATGGRQEWVGVLEYHRQVRDMRERPAILPAILLLLALIKFTNITSLAMSSMTLSNSISLMEGGG